MELKMEEQEESARVGSESRKRERLIDVLTPYILCIIANFFFAGLIIVVKVSLDRGFSPYVLVPYGQAFGALTTGFLALLYERSAWTGDQHWRHGLKISGDNVVVLRSAVTGCCDGDGDGFTVGLRRMEKLDISQRGAQAKIVGTVVAFAGSTLMTLYKGIVVVSLLHTQQSLQTSTSKASLDKNWLKGAFMLVISNVSYSAFYILQSKISPNLRNHKVGVSKYSYVLDSHANMASPIRYASYSAVFFEQGNSSLKENGMIPPSSQLSRIPTPFEAAVAIHQTS
uniref:WAT1-related protein n=1 Tax=Quercus lobata TaxID=97700 RepID=A0A7N2LI95_QUELO